MTRELNALLGALAEKIEPAVAKMKQDTSKKERRKFAKMGAKDPEALRVNNPDAELSRSMTKQQYKDRFKGSFTGDTKKRLSRAAGKQLAPGYKMVFGVARKVESRMAELLSMLAEKMSL